MNLVTLLRLECWSRISSKSF